MMGSATDLGRMRAYSGCGRQVLGTADAANTEVAAANFVLRVNTCTSPTPAARRSSSIATPWTLFRQIVPLFLPQELILWTLRIRHSRLRC